MDTNVSIEAAEDHPVIVVPWAATVDQSDSTAGSYVDLAEDREAIDRLPEAKQWPELRRTLMAMNASGAPFQTAKCDAWALTEDEKQLDFGPVAFGFGAYIDVLLKDAGVFYSASRMQVLAEAWAAAARRLQPDDARVDFVIRPADVHGLAGFAITLYVFAYGDTSIQAREHWQEALEATARLLTQDDTMEARASSSIG